MNGFLLNKSDKRKQYLVAVLSVLFVSGICFSLSSVLGYRVVALILLLTVSILAATLDIVPVLIAAALSALTWNFLFIPPRFTMHVDTTEDGILLLMYFAIAMINGVLTYKIRQTEKALQLKEERANSVQLYNTILNSLSHELRTPISAIIGAADNLKYNANLKTYERDQLYSEIEKAGLRLNQQVENLLNISRLESGHIKPKNDWCDVVEVVYSVSRSVEQNHPGRNINISINQDMPLCMIDKGMLEQVLYNLLNNAAIHSGAGSEIEINATCHGDLLEFEIEDNGKGFGDVNMEEVLNKFSRSNRQDNVNSGLGLSIVKGFTEALMGTVSLSKGKKQGAKFTVSFPVKTNYFSAT
jgi:two-component system sensor histidine kinase KdpD